MTESIVVISFMYIQHLYQIDRVTDHGPVLASTDEYEKEGIKKVCRGQMDFYGRQMLQKEASGIISISAFQMEQRLQKEPIRTV